MLLPTDCAASIEQASNPRMNLDSASPLSVIATDGPQ